MIYLSNKKSFLNSIMLQTKHTIIKDSKMKHYLILTFIALGILGAQTPKAEKAAVKCVVTGDPIDQEEFAAYKAGKVYFCCGGCKEEFQSSNADFITAANFQLVATGQYIQTACPVSGRGMKDSKTYAVNGTDVKFCCNNCLNKTKKSDKKVSLLFSDGAFEKGFSAPEKNKKKVKKKSSL